MIYYYIYDLFLILEEFILNNKCIIVLYCLWVSKWETKDIKFINSMLCSYLYLSIKILYFGGVFFILRFVLLNQ